MIYENRSDAGKRLARELADYECQKPLVLALPRGGMPVAAEIARALCPIENKILSGAFDSSQRQGLVALLKEEPPMAEATKEPESGAYSPARIGERALRFFEELRRKRFSMRQQRSSVKVGRNTA